MKKIYLFVIFVLPGMAAFSQSPISLSNSNMPGSGDTLRYTNVQTTSASIGNYLQTGINYSWNFTTAVSTGEGRRDFKTALSTPYALYFLNLNEYGEKIADTLAGGTGSITITNYYNFYKKQTSPASFIADGVGLTISGVPLPTYYSDKDELYLFPMTYPKYDSTTFKFSTPTTTLLPIKYSKQGYRITVVDGWGSVTTPYGTDNCLRLVTTQYSQDTTVITLPTSTLFPFPLPPIKLGFQNYQRSYQWITATSKIPYFEVSGNLVAGNFTPSAARYRGYNKTVAPPPPPPPPPTGTVTTSLNDETTDLGSDIFPNPVTDELQLRGSQPADVYIFDLSGKLILRLNAYRGSNINVSTLEKGIYILNLKSDTTDSYHRFVKD